jgi:hypothetical protein
MVLISVKRPSRTQGHSVAGRIRAFENSNDLIGNRTRDFPACNIIHRSTTLPRASPTKEALHALIQYRDIYIYSLRRSTKNSVTVVCGPAEI